MPSLFERIIPELKLIESGPQRQRMIEYAISGPRTCIVAFLSVVGATGLFVLWDKLVASVPSSWSLPVLTILCLVGFGSAIWITWHDMRRRLREQLAKKGIPICIPWKPWRCPECGSKLASKPVLSVLRFIGTPLVGPAAVLFPFWREIVILETSGRYCQNCKYDLTGNESGDCPECGEVLQLSIE